MPFRHTDSPSTDFAITSVNVPDRLDQREVDDRKQQDEASLYARRSSALLFWWRRLLPYVVLLVVLALAGFWLAAQRQNLAAGRIAQSLSAALHVPVRVQDSRLRTTPAPALVLSGVDLGGQVQFDEVILEFTAPSLWQAVMSGQRRWGDIVISSTTLRFEQANQLLTWLALLDRVVPDSVTRVRFAQLRFGGSALLPDRYEAVTRREPGGQFTSVVLRRLDSPGSLQLQFTPDRAGGPVSFQCDAVDWQPPFAPRAAWTEMVGTGHVSAASIELDKFTLGSAFGAFEGQLSVRQQSSGAAAWTAEGQFSTVGIDVPTVIQQISNPGKPPPEAGENVATPMSGTASIDALVKGTGATPEEALGSLIAAGEIKVRSAALNGINLGYAASRPAAGGSSSSTAFTRFTRFEASFLASNNGVSFRNIHGSAGALATSGDLTVTRELGLDGLLHVNLGGSRVQAPLRIHVRGTVAHPQFGR
jgi:hypothetical protein